MGNWEKTPLYKDQIKYSACDVYSSLIVYQKLVHLGIQKMFNNNESQLVKNNLILTKEEIESSYKRNGEFIFNILNDISIGGVISPVISDIEKEINSEINNKNNNIKDNNNKDISNNIFAHFVNKENDNVSITKKNNEIENVEKNIASYELEVLPSEWLDYILCIFNELDLIENKTIECNKEIFEVLPNSKESVLKLFMNQTPINEICAVRNIQESTAMNYIRSSILQGHEYNFSYFNIDINIRNIIVEFYIYCLLENNNKKNNINEDEDSIEIFIDSIHDVSYKNNKIKNKLLPSISDINKLIMQNNKYKELISINTISIIKIHIERNISVNGIIFFLTKINNEIIQNKINDEINEKSGVLNSYDPIDLSNYCIII